MACAICGDPTTLARDRCPTCYQFLRRRGSDRSEKLITRLTQRDIEREWARKGKG
jgi:hypothetical protein